MSEVDGVNNNTEVNETTESSYEVEVNDGGSSSDGVKNQMKSESESEVTPSNANSPDLGKESSSSEEKKETNEQDESEKQDNPDLEPEEESLKESGATKDDEEEVADPDNPDLDEEEAEQTEKQKEEEAEQTENQKGEAEQAEKQKEEEAEQTENQKGEAEQAEKQQEEEKAEQAEKQKEEETEQVENQKEEEAEQTENQKGEAEQAEKQKEEETEQAEKQKEEEAEQTENQKEETEQAEKQQEEEKAEQTEKQKEEEAEQVEKQQEEEKAEQAEKQKEEEEAEQAEKQQEEEEAEQAEKQQEEEEAEQAEKQKEEEEAEQAEKQKEEEEAEQAEKQKEEEEAEQAEKQQEEEEAEQAEKQQEEEEAEQAEKQKEEEEAEQAEKQQEEEKAEQAEKQKEEEKAEQAEKQQEEEKAEQAEKQKEEEEAEQAEKQKEEEEAEQAEKQKEEEEAKQAEKQREEEKAEQAEKQKEEEEDEQAEKQKEEEEAEQAEKQKEEEEAAQAEKQRKEEEAKQAEKQREANEIRETEHQEQKNAGETKDVAEEKDGDSKQVENNQNSESGEREETEKNAYLENVSYRQGQNDYGALGTCGPTSIANSLNRLEGTSEYSENSVLHNAMDNDLCSKSDQPYEMGGTTTRDVVSIIDNVKNPEGGIHTEVYEYDNALSVDDLADRLDDPNTVAMVGVDSATLWDQRGDVANSGLFQHLDSPSDHWITVDSPVRDTNGNVQGFNIVDSGGGLDYVGRDKFESIYRGDNNHTVTDPTAIVITNNENAQNTYVKADNIREYSNHKGSAVESDGGDSPGNSNNQSEDLEKTDSEQKHDIERADIAYSVKKITEPYYKEAGALAQNNETGRAFTDHREDHVEMVADKSLEAGQTLGEAADRGTIGQQSNKDGHVALNGRIDERTLEGAALSHDTGMRGDGYALTPVREANGDIKRDENNKKVFEKDSEGGYVVHREDNNNYDEVRDNHSLNSAINVLENREMYKAAGFSDEQVDKMAAECMAHSKSSSGVADLNSAVDWSDCFDRIDATVEAYNNDHPESTITFDRSSFEGDADKLGSLASESLALRIGDVSRDSYADAVAQSGEAVHVDRDTLDNRAGSWKGEIENADITLGEHGTPVDSDKSKQVHAGEQNIIDNHSFLNNEGIFTHEITIDDGVSAPKCTQEAVGDHLGELASAKDEQFEVNLEFEKPCDDYSKQSYEQFRAEAKDAYPNVTINYPWDNEEV